MANLNIKFNNKTYSIDSASLADATATLEAHLMNMMEERLEGDGQEFYTMAPSTLSFRSTAPLNELKDVQINGQTVDPANYELEEGSTIVKLKYDYLSTLDTGKYEVAVVSDNKTVKGDFSVKGPELNEHGFYYNQPYVNVNAEVLMLFYEDGKCDFVPFTNPATQWTYTVNGNKLTLEYAEAEMQCTGTVEANMIHINEMNMTFVLDGETVAADENYVYCYKQELNGYDVRPIDRTKSSYEVFRTNVNDLPVVKINNDAFADCALLTSVGTVGTGASVEIPDSVTSIGLQAFYQCTSLKSVGIPASVTSIGARAFYNCASLESVTFGENSRLETIDEGAFIQCTKLTSIEIPDGVTFIGNNAFYYCKNLTSVKLSASVTTIAYSAFSYCTNLNSITFEGTTAQWNAITFTEYNGVSNWNLKVPATHVHCTDGDVAL